MAWQNDFTPLIYDVIDSTNTECVRIAKRGSKGNFLVWGGVQTSGRGKYGRHWHSEAGNLYFSILLNQPYQIFKASQLVYVASIALVNTLKQISPELQDLVKIKWPNDILLNGKKCSGILLESHISGSEHQCDFVVIGIGINTKVYPKSNDLNYAITSLFENGIMVDNNDMLEKYMNQFTLEYNNWLKDDSFTETKKSWENNAFGINSVVTINSRNSKIKGKILGLNNDGMLLVLQENGEEVCISTGEVFF